jgi:hypothetical protein
MCHQDITSTTSEACVTKLKSHHPHNQACVIKAMPKSLSNILNRTTCKHKIISKHEYHCPHTKKEEEKKKQKKKV